MQTKYGLIVASHLNQYNSLVQVVSAALGGSSSKPKPVQISDNIDEAVAQLNSFLTLG